MTRASISQLKANLSRYLREVRRGSEVEILDRGVPVARLTALSTVRTEVKEDRQRLIKAGILRGGVGSSISILEMPPIEVAGGLSAALDEERADRT